MKSEFSRRDFLKASGVLVVSFSTATWIEQFASAQGPFDTHPSHIDPSKLDSWIAIVADGRVTAYTGKCAIWHQLLSSRGARRDGTQCEEK